MKNIILPKFQEYLRSKSLINEKYISYYALWARIFLAFSKSNGNLSHDVQVQKFIDYLKSQKGIADWQVKQADNAIQLYINQFSDSVESTSLPIQPEESEKNQAVSYER
jgi:hypothetical protein